MIYFNSILIRRVVWAIVITWPPSSSLLSFVFKTHLKPFSPLTLPDQFKPNLVWMLLEYSTQNWCKDFDPSTKHGGRYQRKTIGVNKKIFWHTSPKPLGLSILTWSKSVQHDAIYLWSNFRVNLISNFGVIAFLRHYFDIFNVITLLLQSHLKNYWIEFNENWYECWLGMSIRYLFPSNTRPFLQKKGWPLLSQGSNSGS